ncbi:MAG TPA: tRNA (adenosine(37)-N6)-dimethylallyltransferase MiaA [Stenotrophobium sp.]|nr:tRNA (adenosine(37)-N6)-dimethylallyltransferase MiaA [Stenotrophobium sp.]
MSRGEQSELPVILLMGPTASGKTQLSLDLCERLPAEIISVDSAQVYRGMDIGTAKPDRETRARVPHHLIDILDPAEPYSAARFACDALRLIAGIRGRGHVPLLVGGTMLYFRALSAGLHALPSASPEVRARLEREAATLGSAALHARLRQLDAASAARLHPNDLQRVQRALEIIECTGMTPTEFYARPLDGGLDQPVVKIGMQPPQRAELHARIERRLLQMMQDGFFEEVEALHRRGDLHPALPSIRAVGYRQLWASLDGECSREEAVQRCLAATRQFAKRQLTWLRREPDVHWLDSTAANLTGQAMNLLK